MGKYLSSITGNLGSGGSGGGSVSRKIGNIKIGGGGSGVSNGSTPNQNDSAIGISSLSELSSGSGGSNVTEYQKKIESTQTVILKTNQNINIFFAMKMDTFQTLQKIENSF